MRLITFKRQCKVFKALIEILKVLVTVEGVEADDAICDVYRIAEIVGGKEMLKHLRGGARIKRVTNGAMKEWSKDEMLRYIRLLEEMVEQEATA